MVAVSSPFGKTPYILPHFREVLDMLQFVWMFLIGIVVGAIARLLMPGPTPMGFLMTGILGVAGSFVGGAISRLFSKPAPDQPIHPAGILMSIIGALVILFVVNQLRK